MKIYLIITFCPKYYLLNDNPGGFFLLTNDKFTYKNHRGSTLALIYSQWQMGLMICKISAMYLILSLVGSKSISLFVFTASLLVAAFPIAWVSVGTIQSLSSTLLGAFF